MPPRRSVALAAVFAVVVSLPLFSAPQGLASPQVERDAVEALRRQAAKTKRELEKATKAWEARKEKLAQSEGKLKKTLSDLAAADAELDKIRAPIAELANALYQQPGGSGLVSVLNQRDPSRSLRYAADLSHVAGQHEQLIQKVEGLRQRRQQLAAEAQRLQSSNAIEQVKLTEMVGELKRRSEESTRQLSATLEKVRADRERRFARSCSRDKVAEARRYPNGLIPDRFLCNLPQKGEELRADAARAFFKMNDAYRKRFGTNMCITDSYRNLTEQQQVYAQRPGFAAIPGRSNHGMGTALDLCGGVETQGSVQFRWLEANAGKYGWFHPSWAYSNPFEPWHWEYGSES